MMKHLELGAIAGYVIEYRDLGRTVFYPAMTLHSALGHRGSLDPAQDERAAAWDITQDPRLIFTSVII